MKKALMVASMASMLDNFNTHNIELLDELGYEVTLAANFEREDSNSRERVKSFADKMQKKYLIKQIDFTRRIGNIRGQIESYGQVKELTHETYDLVHCHSPICAAMTRLAFRRNRKNGTKIIYTAHGFHFYKGAPIKNWMLFFPVEWLCSLWTDLLITINREDYSNAKRHLRAKKTVYIPGVGIELKKFRNQDIKGEEKQAFLNKIGIDGEAQIVLSVGEINSNKNHEVVIQAIARLHDSRVHYVIAGKGDKYQYLCGQAAKLGISKQVHFLGFCEEIQKIYGYADIFAFPSHREGLSVALMEAMASGKPVVCSEIRGNIDLIEEGKGGILCSSDKVEDYVKALQRLLENRKLQKEMGEYNKKKIGEFGIENVSRRMKKIYERI